MLVHQDAVFSLSKVLVDRSPRKGLPFGALTAFAAVELIPQLPGPVFILKNRVTSVPQYVFDRFHDRRQIFKRFHTPEVVAAIHKGVKSVWPLQSSGGRLPLPAQRSSSLISCAHGIFRLYS